MAVYTVSVQCTLVSLFVLRNTADTLRVIQLTNRNAAYKLKEIHRVIWGKCSWKAERNTHSLLTERNKFGIAGKLRDMEMKN